MKACFQNRPLFLPLYCPLPFDFTNKRLSFAVFLERYGYCQATFSLFWPPFPCLPLNIPLDILSPAFLYRCSACIILTIFILFNIPGYPYLWYHSYFFIFAALLHRNWSTFSSQDVSLPSLHHDVFLVITFQND